MSLKHHRSILLIAKYSCLLLCGALLLGSTLTAAAAEGVPNITNSPQSQVVLQGDPVTFSVGADGTTPFTYRWYRNGSLISSASNSFYTISSTAASDNGARFYVVVSNALGTAKSAEALLVIDAGTLVTTTNRIILMTNLWKYDQSGIELGTAWTSPSYNDSTWPKGLALLYVETAALPAPINTPLTIGRLTYYFRTHFNVDAPGRIVAATLRFTTVVDDGAAFFVNGSEVFDLYVNPGAPYSDVATRTVGDAVLEGPFEATVTNLVNGDNVLAATAKQINSTSSDVVFGMEADLIMTRRIHDNVPPVVQQIQPAPNYTINSLTYVSVTFDEPVSGVDASDLLVNGQPATNLTAISSMEYQFRFPQPATGAVTVAWSTTHGIRDQAPTPNAFAGGNWSYVLDTNAPSSAVIISEFMADNEHGIRDEDGNRSDWIEIYNPGPFDVNLGGWFLTDESTNLTKWQFPPMNLAANKYLLVWASNKDRTNPAAPLHTNFRLEKGGEYLALLDPWTNVVSAFSPTYPAQVTDVSFGRDRTMPSMTGFFTTPTPGAQNSTTGTGFAPDPVFSLQSGVYTNNSLTLTISAPSGTIRYTTDGTVPGSNSTVYVNPIPISANATIKARVFESGVWPGQVLSRVFILMDQTARSFTSKLPIVIMNTGGAGIAQNVAPGQPRTRGSLVVIDSGDGRSSWQTDPDYVGVAEFEIFGQTSAGFAKQPFNIEVQDELGNDKSVPLLGMPAEADWKLRNPYSDKCLMNDFLGYELFEKMGHYSVRRRFVEAFVDTSGGKVTYPGDYYGVLVLLERIEQGKDRVDIAELTPSHTNEPAISGGYMWKKDKDSTGDLNFSTSGGSSAGFSGQALKIHVPKPRDITTDQLNWLRNYLNRMESAMYAANWLTATGTNHYSNYLDVDNFVDQHWIVEFTKQIDGYRLSNYMQKDRGGRVKMEPIWDWNLSFGNANYLQGGYTNGWYWSNDGEGINENNHIWLRRLITGTSSTSGTAGDPEFNQKIADRWSVLRTNVLNGTNVNARIREIANLLSEAAVRDFSKFPRLGSEIWPNPNGARNGTANLGRDWDVDYVSPLTYSGIISNMQRWVLGRYLWIDSQFTPSPRPSLPSGLVSSGQSLYFPSVPGATIYYTVNGTDPRLPGGGISSKALTYTGPIPLNSNVWIVARAKAPANGWFNTWSGPAEAALFTQIPNLRITEIMYHPAAGAAGDPYDVDEYEYIELKNIGSTSLSLAGFMVTNAVQFVFSPTNAVTSLPSGACVLLVKNLAAFALRYPDKVALVAGQYKGSLANDGDRLTLLGPLHETIQDISYSDQWYPVTDGAGFSLVAVSTDAGADSWSAPSQWRPSTYNGGTPGDAETAPVAVPTVWVNEALSHSVPPAVDVIELFNPNSFAVDLSGWYLSDSLTEPFKYRMTNGASIGALGYLQFTEAEFNAPGAPTGFALSSAGDQVYLFSGDTAGHLTGYLHGFDFGDAAPGVTFGRYVDSLGTEHFVPQGANTLGWANAGPAVGPVVINEIMYYPPLIQPDGVDNIQAEYIELLNVSGSTVDLWDPIVPTNTWRLANAVDYSFPTNTSLAPGEFVVVVHFNPSDTNALATFRATYGMSAGVRVFGPCSGQLGNTHETIELKEPFAGTLPGDPALWPTVDRVAYSALTPWPCTTSGTGNSLQRQDPLAFGNDVVNWRGCAPTAGRANTLAPADAPYVLTQPVSLVVPTNASAQFSVEVCGLPPFAYQWLFNNAPITNATNATFTVPAAMTSDTGDYRAVIANSAGATTSQVARLSVEYPPSISQQPQSQTVLGYTTVTFSAGVQGTPPFRYQWLYQGTNLPGATNLSLVLNNVQYYQAGVYALAVTNATGWTISEPATLVVNMPATIIQQPQGTNVIAGTNTLTPYNVTLRVEAVGTGTITYQWQFWGTNLPGATNNTLTLNYVSLNHAGPYTVTVKDQMRSITSQTAWVYVMVKPFIYVHPQSQSVVSNGTVALSVLAGPVHPTLPLSYRWLRTNITLVASGSSTLILPNVTSSNQYRVVVTNLAGQALSGGANVSVLADSDGDGIPDVVENANGLDPNNPADGALDLDGDGMSNADEYVAGTNPKDPASVLKLASQPPGTGSSNATALRFPAVSNKTYTVQFTEGLGSGTWSNWQKVEAVATNRWITLTNLMPAEAWQRFYRVRTPLVP